MERLLLSELLLREHMSKEEYQKYGKKLIFSRGNLVYLPTDRLDTLFILDRGAVKLGSYSPQGAEVTYDIVCPGEFFGNLQYLPNNIFSEFAKTLTTTEVYSYPTLLVKEIIRRDEDVADRFHEVMVRRWCRAESKLFANASLSPEERVRQLIRQYSQKVPIKEKKLIPISELLTQKDIADLTGLTRQTVAHITKRLLKKPTPSHVKAA